MSPIISQKKNRIGVMVKKMTDPTKCARCGQGDCPTLVYAPGPITNKGQTSSGNLGWTAAFQACATMRHAIATEQADEYRTVIREHDKHCTRQSHTCWLCERNR